MNDSNSKTHKVLVPPLHAVLIYATLLLLVGAGAAYLFAPADKAPVFQSAVTGLLAFFFGKLSNGFGKPMVPGADADGEGQ